MCSFEVAFIDPVCKIALNHLTALRPMDIRNSATPYANQKNELRFFVWSIWLLTMAPHLMEADVGILIMSCANKGTHPQKISQLAEEPTLWQAMEPDALLQLNLNL